MESFVYSDNQLRADNQQGRLEPWWIVGFVDGEGCFSISVFKNSTTKLGVQVFPEFVVTQGAKSLSTLEYLQEFFQVGRIYENKRNDNHKESLYRYCVRSLRDIQEKIIPFFHEYQLNTAKQQDFLLFCQVVDMISRKQHLTLEGLEKIKALVTTMNRRKTRL